MLIIHNVRSKKRNEMEEKIKNILSNSYTKKGEFDEDKALNQLCVLLGVSESNPLMDDMQNCIILAKPNYLHKDGKISSACYKIVGEQKIYFTHKDNLYSR